MQDICGTFSHNEFMRRILLDLLAIGLLTGPIVLHLLPLSSGLFVLLSVPIIVGFGRGFAEFRFLNKIPYWVAGIEWAMIVVASDVILCIPDSKSGPRDNLMTVVGAFLVIFIIPSVLLSTISYWLGLVLAVRQKPA